MSYCRRSAQYNVAKWLPSDQKILDKWLSDLIKKVKVDYKDKLELLMKLHPIANNEEEATDDIQPISDASAEVKKIRLHAPIQELVELIQCDPEVNMFFYQMFWQQYQNPDATSGARVPCWQLAILLINKIMTTAPRYNDTGLVGFPINAILNWPMQTTAGYAAFLNDKVNSVLKEILNYWGDFLKEEASCYVLNDDPKHGWFGEAAQAQMPGFEDDYICDPSAPYHGFKSWDDFFTREFRPGVRDVEDPHDDAVVANACESAPYRLSTNVKKRDFFWIKAHRYSLSYILNHNSKAEQFYGGTVYQAFLSALSYHRWHSPVSGTIVDTEVVDGSYYSQQLAFQADPSAPNESQGYLPQVASRGVVYIQADNPAIGLMAFVSIGMSEVSSNEITVQKGDRVKKGDPLGMFHFGGSTHLLIFSPEVQLKFDLRGQEPSLHSKNIKVKERIATIIDPSA